MEWMFMFICWSCGKEHNAKNINVNAVNVMCGECGGYVVTPSGKVQIKKLEGDQRD